jgi:hypothetical protein
MSDFETDYRWQMEFVPVALDIIGNVRMPINTFTQSLVAPREMDIKRNADLLLVPFGGKTIAMRMRRPGYFRRYGLDITIRSERRITKAETELSKLRRGLGDWFFYGHIEHGWSP